MKKFLVIFGLVIFGQIMSTAQVKVSKNQTDTDLELRAYTVRLYLVQKLPVMNNSLMPWIAAVVYHKYPTSWSEIELLVSVPEFARRRGYRICKDCPLEVLPIYALD
jgi:hypothetical protein